MNVFRLLGDLSHLLAIVILLLKIWKTRSCAGISGKTQARVRTNVFEVIVSKILKFSKFHAIPNKVW